MKTFLFARAMLTEKMMAMTRLIEKVNSTSILR